MHINKSPWINLKDKKPNTYEEVLVEVDGHRGSGWRNNHNLVAFMTSDGAFFEERHRDCPLVGVIAWMPLPEPFGQF